ncbi:glucose 1-dehydrogenase [Nitzschia inconspicua]|uniref:Glucose 1-dehydrogenase n=1 Tax=Nitzschia inconspicua TaxID=303405 RepID=A0A9K3M375_9STRA|nr:glucose 1-dehydrogenase [Nitzschia inconspicua]
MKTTGLFLQSMLGMERRVAIVTGSTGGLGRAIVETLAQMGCRVVVNGRNEKKTAKAARDIIEKCNLDPSKVLAAHGDTSDPEQAKSIVEKVQKQFGCLDILINNAGINLPEGSFEDQYSPEQWETIQKVNICGPMNMVHASLPMLRKSDDGRIINMSSMIAHVGSPANTLYSMTKAAILIFTKCLAADLAGETKIRVNSISPGIFKTEMNQKFTENKEKLEETEGGVPMKRLGEPDELATVVAMVASKVGSYMTGTDVIVDGGVTSV